MGNDMKEKWYRTYEGSTELFVAQGSEFGFGKQYARGINDEVLDHATDKYLQVVSCNTHNLSLIIKMLGLGDEGPDNLVQGRFICMRRANDISQDGKFVPSPEIGSHGIAPRPSQKQHQPVAHPAVPPDGAQARDPRRADAALRGQRPRGDDPEDGLDLLVRARPRLLAASSTRP
jgi:hypothetical protein